MHQTQNLNVISVLPLISPKELKAKLPISEKIAKHVLDSRKTIENILNKEDQRLLVAVGPCSIYDAQSALEYAKKLKALKEELNDKLFIIMRAYFEKPRTTVGWKGFINDPHLTGQGDISEGLFLGRKLLLEIADMGLPVATEMLDPIVPQYISDLITWASIGARTTESQTHREMASGLSMPVGYKNSTEGSLDVAINAMEAARHSHDFLGINQDGQTAIIKTKGNPSGHVILRGGKVPNYDEANIIESIEKLKKSGFKPNIMIDCSHGNSLKKHENQEKVCKAVVDLRLKGYTDVIGMMIESNLFEGNQKVPNDVSQIQYGVSITDACISWETTERILKEAASRLA